MDIYIIILTFFILILSCYFTKGNNKNKAVKKGMEGEKKVRNVLKKLPREYMVLNDLLIRHKSGISQIDHVVIGRKGIFVIETKNYSGKIYGDINSRYWTQKLNGRENKFYSPVWQNRTHVNAIKFILRDFEKIPVYSLIVFCGDCNIKNIKGVESVVKLKKVNKYIKKAEENIITDKEEIRNIFRVLNNNNIHSKRIRQEHIKMIKKEYI